MADDRLVRPYRLLPLLDDAVRPFWTGGARGELTFWRCQSCGHYLHPPAPVCPVCLSRDLTPKAVSGQGTVVSFTVNHRAWNRTVPVPYVVALVELAEQQGLRLIANLVGADPGTLTVGLPVRVIFEHEDDVWLPSFQPDQAGQPGQAGRPGLAAVASGRPGPSPARSGAALTRRRAASWHSRAAKAESHAVITGIGQSQIGRRLGRSSLDLTIEAALAAVADAGLSRDQIDGLATCAGTLAGMGGLAGPGTAEVQDALRLNLSWHGPGLDGPGQLGPVINAVLAVAAGAVRHVLIYRTVTEATARQFGGEPGIGLPPRGGGAVAGNRRVTGPLQWSLPFHAYSAANAVALYATAHFHRYGTTSEQLAQVALNARRYAAMNKQAVCASALTMSDYLAAPVITTPLRLHDCDVACDGSTALIVSAAESAHVVAKPVRFEAMGAAIRGRSAWDQWADLTTTVACDAAAQLWSRTDLRPADVDTAQLYDGFSFLALAWLEALRFCGPGEAGPFVADGTRISPVGELPMNTWGGQLAGGRLHGFGHLHEAVLQLRGEAGDRQVPDAEVAVASAGAGPMAGCLLLTT